MISSFFLYIIKFWMAFDKLRFVSTNNKIMIPCSPFFLEKQRWINSLNPDLISEPKFRNCYAVFLWIGWTENLCWRISRFLTVSEINETKRGQQKSNSKFQPSSCSSHFIAFLVQNTHLSGLPLSRYRKWENGKWERWG
jgi:hypothetical protein